MVSVYGPYAHLTLSTKCPCLFTTRAGNSRCTDKVDVYHRITPGMHGTLHTLIVQECSEIAPFCLHLHLTKIHLYIHLKCLQVVDIQNSMILFCIFALHIYSLLHKGSQISSLLHTWKTSTLNTQRQRWHKLNRSTASDQCHPRYA